MNLRQIEYFVRVAELRSFTRASHVLGVSQPSLSRQVRLLEVELRQTLLHRNGRGIELTPAGECLLERGEDVLQAVGRAVSSLNELRTELRGKVVVGLPSRVARVLTTALVRAFRSKFPRASITVAEGNSSDLHEALLIGRVDVALLFEPHKSPNLELERLHDEELVLVGPRGSAQMERSVPLRRLPRYPLILPRTPNATRSILEAAVAKVGVTMQVCAEVDTTQNILELIGGRVGYGVLPRGAVAQAGGGARFAVSRIHGPAMRQHLYIASTRRRASRLATEVCRLVQEANVPRLLG